MSRRDSLKTGWCSLNRFGLQLPRGWSHHEQDEEKVNRGPDPSGSNGSGSRRRATVALSEVNRGDLNNGRFRRVIPRAILDMGSSNHLELSTRAHIIAADGARRRHFGAQINDRYCRGCPGRCFGFLACGRVLALYRGGRSRCLCNDPRATSIRHRPWSECCLSVGRLRRVSYYFQNNDRPLSYRYRHDRVIDRRLSRWTPAFKMGRRPYG